MKACGRAPLAMRLRLDRMPCIHSQGTTVLQDMDVPGSDSILNGNDHHQCMDTVTGVYDATVSDDCDEELIE